jgi:hypothetical protein
VLDEKCPYCSGQTPLVDRVRERLADMPEDVQATVEAELAVTLAYKLEALGEQSTAPTAKELRGVMELLRSWSTEQTNSGDSVDRIADQLAARRAGRTG